MVAEDRPQLNISLNSLKVGFKVGLNNPKALGNYITSGLGKSVQGQVYDLALAIGWDTWALSNYWHMIRANTKLKDYVEAKLSGVNYGQIIVPELLYVLVRKLCPETVVETGVAAGVSSAYILQALEDNEYGRLYSIDFPNYAMVTGQPIPQGMELGFAIPNNLRHRWELLKGKSGDLLRPLMRRLNAVDIFFHDSEHSYENMGYEYNEAWRHLKTGGLLISHDINDNKAFGDFAKWTERKPHEIYFTGMGVIRK